MPSPLNSAGGLGAAAVETLARERRDGQPDTVKFAALHYKFQIWCWDFERSVLQDLGITVSTNAHWRCPVSPPARPEMGLEPLLLRLESAKKALADVPPEVAETIFMAECIVADTLDGLTNLLGDPPNGIPRPTLEMIEDLVGTTGQGGRIGRVKS